jgi:hypothetical protein
MRKTFILITFMLFLSVFNTDGQTKDSLSYSFSGFVRFDYWNDTRVNDEAVEGLFSLVPSQKVFDSYGNDLNERSSANALALASRIKLVAAGVKIFGANTSSFLEADFTGTSGSSRVRFRHAAITLGWQNSSLLIGLYWHPMVVTGTLPSIISLNTGAPFQPFNRSPQVTFTHNFIGSFGLAASASWQSDYTSNGPVGYSSSYIRNAALPDFTFHLKYANAGLEVGALGDIFVIQPRTYTVSLLNGNIRKATTTLTSLSYQGYIKYTNKQLFVIAKAIMGQNLAHQLLIGGYGTTSIDSQTGAERYTPFNDLSTYLNIGYGNAVKASIFLGYEKNLGTNKVLVGSDQNIYGRSLNIASLVRIAPNITWTVKNFMLGSEVEYTNAEYGTFEFPSKGRLTNCYRVSNTRLLFLAIYNF